MASNVGAERLPPPSQSKMAISPIAWTIADIRRQGSAKIDAKWAEYINSGSMDSISTQANEEAYNAYRIVPRILRNVAEVDASTTIFGQKVSMPFGFSPAAMHCLAHPEGEVATSRAAAKANIAMGLSHWATRSMEDVRKASAEVGGTNPYGIQSSGASTRSGMQTLFKKASELGYRAVIMTVDAPTLGRRLAEYRNGINLPPGMKFPNIVDEKSGESPASFVGLPRDASTTWDKLLPWLSDPDVVPEGMEIWLKGVYAPEDVYMAATYPRVKGVIISNHGGRQLDGCPATLEALPDCAEAARNINSTRSPENKLMLGIDGGIRRGTDIFKAVALGADMCFAGRIPIWGLGYAGEAGVSRAIQLLREEFEMAMRLAGVTKLSQINKHCLAVLTTGRPGIMSRL
ncbi:uncharacterized protein PV06_00586 [Exophiala oligosperma]|uniref:FMN hydroxy acid dehydrogenase domain-containing protein n=1 Tax=Exophiala oligosperma TaxID=215243 RepID=A0A0D2DXY3_9EURO|nr:uncharacterized protein PV06_00586 [Exophiala oligosperma]KIW47938.1 hypothetical protein PV06_00586 [Exophiala oligosperma]